MKARVTYTRDGTITSVASGDGLVADDDELSAMFDLPDDFPHLTGRDAESEVKRAASRLRVNPDTVSLEIRS